jgi:hypothetical protein
MIHTLELKRWMQVVLGPLPATILLLPVLLAGGLGAAIALLATLFDPARSLGEVWGTVASAGMILVWIGAGGLGVLALWAVVLEENPAFLRQDIVRWPLAIGLALGLMAAIRWIWVMATGRHSYSTTTWVVWLGLLLGPVVLGAYHLVRLVRR